MHGWKQEQGRPGMWAVEAGKGEQGCAGRMGAGTVTWRGQTATGCRNQGLGFKA